MNGRAFEPKLVTSTRRSRQMQNVSTLVSRPVRIGTAAVTGLVAFAAGVALAAATPALVAGLTASQSSTTTVSVPAAGAEQIAHNRSEAGFGAAPSPAAEQISHNRDEGGMAGR
jgi:hypothetical protein